MFHAVRKQKALPGSDHAPPWRLINDERLDLTIEDIEALGIDVAVQGDKLAGRHARAKEDGVV